ncbi:acyl-coenzyme A synthetase ACSM3, mitochondrial-like [Bradysia coprophila]|uniref:acyl-coenzyme A synthetase ACSM3, mitochondrial-like n=1 Tax=Bradysia coprophila TaxID=38358 RepID=UPI00187DC769|nr:acyl-coenzyme A synthetase ACSM3, mitochondrial-like [Bradysia coprophila]
MTFLVKSKVFLQFPLKNVMIYRHALLKTNSRQFASTANRDRLDLEAICRSGHIPKRFNFARDVFDRHVVERPSATALWFDNDTSEHKFTFSELKRESVRAAVALGNILELSEQSKCHTSPYILVILPRVPEWWFLHLAAIRMGIIFCPGTTMLTSQDIQYRLEASQAKAVITDSKNMWKIDEAVKGLKESSSFSPPLLRKITVSPSHGDLQNDWLNYDDLISKVNADQVTDFNDADMDSESIAQIYFTSGTTGKPKMVAHSQVSYGIGHYKTSALLDLKPNDVNWCIADTGWAKSSYSNFFAPWITGCTVYIHQMERFEARKILEVLHTKPITTFCAPPTMYKSLIQIPDEHLFRFHSIRYCVGGGEAVGAEVAKVWKQKTGIILHELYGQSEMTAIGGWAPAREGSMGIPNKDPGYDVVIIDDEGTEVPRNTEGNIALRVKPNWPVGLFKGYMKGGPNGPEFDKEKNDSCFIGDFYNTGDRAYMDNDGSIFYVGRSDDVIISAGYRIGPVEVESVLQTHPAVVENAAVASPDEVRGSIVKAFIVLAEQYKNHDQNQLVEELQAFFKRATAPYKYPRKIEFVESLPKTISGKILRRELKKSEEEKYKQKKRND